MIQTFPDTPLPSVHVLKMASAYTRTQYKMALLDAWKQFPSKAEELHDFDFTNYIEDHYGVPARICSSRVQRTIGAQPILVPEDHEGAVCIPDKAGVSRYWMGTERRPHVRAKLIECPDGVTRSVPCCYRRA